MHNLGTVVKFELIRTFKKITFWISVLSMPAIFVVFGAIGYFSSEQSIDSTQKLEKEEFSFQITDKSGIVSDELLTQLEGKKTESREEAIEKVKTGEIDAYYYIPKDLTQSSVEIYGLNKSNDKNDRYQAVLSSLMANSSIESVDTNKIAAINSTYKTEVKIYKDGQEYDPISEMIAPGIFFVAFYLIVALLSNQMLTSTTEEKENRVTEMILTSITSRTMIIGKILSLIIIGFVQILAVILPIIIGYIVATKVANIPDISPMLASIKWQLWPVLTGVIVLLTGFVTYTGLCVAISAAMPTAKEANNFFGVLMILMISPLFFSHALSSSDPSLISQGLSYFPLTSPFALLLRNTLGTLTVADGVIGVVILIIFSIFSITAAIRIFRYGTISYNSRVNIKQALSKK